MANFSYKINDDMQITLTKEIVEKNCAGGKSITDEAYTQFAALCKQHKLNPFTREAHIVVVNNANGTVRYNIMIGKDGYFKMADSNPNYDGMQDGIVIEDKNGNIQYPEGCFVPPGCKLLAGWAKAYSKERKYPKYAVCSLSEYKGSDKTLWGTKPATMINKVAKCLALRDLFPQTYNGTYDEAEINNIEVESEEAKPVVETVVSKPEKVAEEVKQTVAKTTVAKAESSNKTSQLVMSVEEALKVKTTGKNGKEMTLGQMLDACTTKEQANSATKFLKEQALKKTAIAEPCLVLHQAIMKTKEYTFKNVKA